MKALPKGIYYKVLSEGNQSSPQPSVRSIDATLTHFLDMKAQTLYEAFETVPSR